MVVGRLDPRVDSENLGGGVGSQGQIGQFSSRGQLGEVSSGQEKSWLVPSLAHMPLFALPGRTRLGPWAGGRGQRAEKVPAPQ